MSFNRLFVVVLALGLAGASCTCGSKPVKNTLKPDGEACGVDEECESSLCDHLPGKSNVCFKKCSATCNAGDICTALAAGDRFACVPEVPGLCQPCALNVDCPYPGDRCLEIGGTKVCARDCSFDGQCPTSYRCADGTDTNGAYVTKQCQPTSGTCECVAASAGQTTPCSEMNSFGTCNGVRTCRPPNGYEACTAPVPTAESCNGRDDDCNGMTDENLGETTCGIGECRRTITNCVNGAPQVCDPLPAGTELCDEKDNDCDGLVDDGFDKTTVQNCGACGNVCLRANATPACMTGMCRIGACLPGFIDANLIDADGCELMCTVTGPEVCDGVDNDCDGMTDEGFSTSSDPTNCGLCGRVCNVNNGNISQYACVASTCGIMTCNTGFADCDQAYGTGCEKNVSADINNCGDCNVVCTTPNGTPACASSACAVGSCNVGYSNCDMLVPNGCEIQTATDVDFCGSCTNACLSRPNSTRTCVAGGCGFTCDPGFVNLDGLAANGCEYSCTATGIDDPDDTSTDQNCDGIDGDESRAIFVATSGADINPGTRALPKLTVQAGINAASTVRPHVYVSAGVYSESITLRAGISVFGGYSATNNWVRNSGLYTSTVRSDITVSGRVIAASGLNITTPTRLAYLTLRAGNASGASASAYGLHCVNCSALTVWRTNIMAGAGANGLNGTSGSKGADGTDGSPGGSGNVDGPAGAGGNGGTSTCGRGGGRGGNGGPEGSNRGQDGTAGNFGGAAGSGGNGCNGGLCGGCNASPGTNGGSGGAGSNGADGTGGASFSVASNYLVCQAGLNGTDGTPGNGGGGGGGGGGQGGNCVNDGGGNGGGGGGAGGCGGTLATGGGAGGSSIAVFLVNSTGATFQNCTFTSGSGGTGGTGGTGGGQGIRGTGRGGGTAGNGSEIGRGGNGADGTSGGRGGHGGGGMGGFSFGIYRVNSTPTVTAPTYITGAAGSGGGAPVSAGANGQSGDIN